MVVAGNQFSPVASAVSHLALETEAFLKLQRWNSAIFEELAANAYVSFLVTEDWLHSADFSLTAYYQELSWMQGNISSLHNFTNTECIQQYSSSPFVADLGNVALVTFDRNATNSYLHESYNTPQGGGLAYRWICSKENYDKHGNCDPSVELKHPESWRPFDDNFPLLNDDKIHNATVKACYAEKRSPNCHLGISPPILIIVAVCNFVKLICFLSTLYIGTETTERTTPLVTTGDAVASFLQRPDPHTRGRCLLTKKHVTKSSRGFLNRKLTPQTASLLDKPSTAFHSPNKPTMAIQQTFRKPRWFRSASAARWLACLIPSFLLIIVPILLLSQYSLALRNTPSLVRTSGFGRPRPDELVLSNEHRSLPSASLLANTPQLLLSYTYFAYNGLFTVMLATNEYLSFAKRRRGLRVTTPKPGSEQRSRYYLHLPYRYSIPILGGSALLHWLVSQSIFLLRVVIYDTKGIIDDEAGLSAVGYSPLAIIISASVGFLFVIAVVVLGFARRFDGSMPLPGGCSAVVAAACQPLGEEKEDGESLAEKKVQFGVTGVYDGGEGVGDRGLNGGGVFNEVDGDTLVEGRVVMHASFSAGDVSPLEEGSWYA
jgi:hypothetical protein